QPSAPPPPHAVAHAKPPIQAIPAHTMADSWRDIPHAVQQARAPDPASGPIIHTAPRQPRDQRLPIPRDLESIIGANWLAKLGVAAIAVAAGFFLQYAFRSGWITPWGQVAIGLCGSVVMMGLAQFLLTKERYRSYAQVLASGGIVVYFLSFYAAYVFYQPLLMGFGPAFGALVV